VQTLTDVDLDRAQALDLADLLNRNLGSVTINGAQNNPLQPDIQFRGFTASPLLGLPQGIAVYQNAVRVNEVFGDTVNWLARRGTLGPVVERSNRKCYMSWRAAGLYSGLRC
jgi:hypothetical protein